MSQAIQARAVGTLMTVTKDLDSPLMARQIKALKVARTYLEGLADGKNIRAEAIINAYPTS